MQFTAIKARSQESSRHFASEHEAILSCADGAGKFFGLPDQLISRLRFLAIYES